LRLYLPNLTFLLAIFRLYLLFAIVSYKIRTVKKIYVFAW